jgi:hypothetical protein
VTSSELASKCLTDGRKFSEQKCDNVRIFKCEVADHFKVISHKYTGETEEKYGILSQCR